MENPIKMDDLGVPLFSHLLFVLGTLFKTLHNDLKIQANHLGVGNSW